MKNAEYWNIFELTGNINDYLNYACASEERQEAERDAERELKQKEGGQADESGNGNGNGFISHAHWRI